LARSLDFTVVN